MDDLQQRTTIAMAEQESLRINLRKDSLKANPFDPRTEVSADARKIVRQMWIIFVLLPLVLFIIAKLLMPN